MDIGKTVTIITLPMPRPRIIVPDKPVKEIEESPIAVPNWPKKQPAPVKKEAS